MENDIQKTIRQIERLKKTERILLVFSILCFITTVILFIYE